MRYTAPVNNSLRASGVWQATPFEFRFRMPILVLLYVLGFWAPWERSGGANPATTWLVLSGSLARLHWLPLATATETVTIAAILCAFAGALLRIWGAAWLGSTIVASSRMHAHGVLADGPYRHLRNPLYLGSLLFSLAIAILMPLSGALVFLVASLLFYLRLILGEEAYLAVQQGDAYLDYKQRVPRLVPALRSRIPASGARPNYAQGLLGELYPFGMACCFLVLAWRYNSQLLIQALLICFGLSLVVRALLPKTPRAA
jgi:protein-S-isoprenylcysteine O-methyltransferase Ste14